MPVSIQSATPRRAVIVGGVRTPVVRAFTSLLEWDTIRLGAAAVAGVLERSGVPRSEVDAIIWGGVVLPSGAPNVGREIGLDLGLDPRVEAMTVSRACASGLQAITLAAAAIERGEADVVIAGGGDSTSNAEVKMGQRLVHALAPVALGKKMGPKDWLAVAAQLTPISELLPVQPKVAERSTGQTMGQAAEHMAERNGISREAQDQFAAESHRKTAAAEAAGWFSPERIPLQTAKGEISADGLLRADTTVEKLAKLKPVFSRTGTLTAGNSSALTDGAGAVLLMSEERARSLGVKPLAAFRSWAYVGVDPADQLLIGPALAMPLALSRAGMELSDVGLVDIHEAFAAQVLCVLQALGSDGFARLRLGRDRAVGEVDPARLNIRGGSLALGHPFAATGARLVTSMANALAAGQAETALLGICAAGGLGAAAVLERV